MGENCLRGAKLQKPEKILPIRARALILVSLPYDSFCEIFARMQSHAGRLRAGLWMLDACRCLVAPYVDA